MEKITAIPTLISSALKRFCHDSLGVVEVDTPFRAYYSPADTADLQVAIHIPCRNSTAAEKLFGLRQCLSKKIIQLHCGKWVFIRTGTTVYPGWEVDSMVGMEEAEGDLLKRVADAPYSSGIVDIESNRLIWGSKSIQKTAGRSAIDMIAQRLDYIDLQGQQRTVISGDQNATWEGFEEGLADMNRDLLQQGVLENYSYRACTWDLQGDVWHVKPVQYIARLIEVLTLGDRPCRVTSDVRIVD